MGSNKSVTGGTTTCHLGRLYYGPWIVWVECGSNWFWASQQWTGMGFGLGWVKGELGLGWPKRMSYPCQRCHVSILTSCHPRVVSWFSFVRATPTTLVDTSFDSIICTTLFLLIRSVLSFQPIHICHFCPTHNCILLFLCVAHSRLQKMVARVATRVVFQMAFHHKNFIPVLNFLAEYNGIFRFANS